MVNFGLYLLNLPTCDGGSCKGCSRFSPMLLSHWHPWLLQHGAQPWHTSSAAAGRCGTPAPAPPLAGAALLCSSTSPASRRGIAAASNPAAWHAVRANASLPFLRAADADARSRDWSGRPASTGGASGQTHGELFGPALKGSCWHAAWVGRGALIREKAAQRCGWTRWAAPCCCAVSTQRQGGDCLRHVSCIHGW